jgi:hypothetical protein
MQKLAQFTQVLGKFASGEVAANDVLDLVPGVLEETGEVIQAQAAKIAQLSNEREDASATARAASLVRGAEEHGLPLDRLYGGDVFETFEDKVAALAAREDLGEIEKAAQLAVGRSGSTELGPSAGARSGQDGRPSWQGVHDDIANS